MRILQIGYGGFGPVHLRAWMALGLGDRLWVADPDPAARERARRDGLPEARLLADHRALADPVDAVDIVAPLQLHAPLTLEALAAGRHVFLEKPACVDAHEAEAMIQARAEVDRVVQVGYFFRCHPLAEQARTLVRDGAIGTLRHLSGDFLGYKRARGDSGVVENDAVHFLDLMCWLAGAWPERVQAITRDHFGRGRADLVLAMLGWPDGSVGRLEAGYIQPGALPDPIVPGAITTKRLTIAGSEGALELDVQTNVMTRHRVRHDRDDQGIWRPVFAGSELHYGPPADPVTVVAREFAAFLEAIRSGGAPVCGLEEGARRMTALIAAIHAAAAEGTTVRPKA